MNQNAWKSIGSCWARAQLLATPHEFSLPSFAKTPNRPLFTQRVLPYLVASPPLPVILNVRILSSTSKLPLSLPSLAQSALVATCLLARTTCKTHELPNSQQAACNIHENAGYPKSLVMLSVLSR